LIFMSGFFTDFCSRLFTVKAHEYGSKHNSKAGRREGTVGSAGFKIQEFRPVRLTALGWRAGLPATRPQCFATRGRRGGPKENWLRILGSVGKRGFASGDTI